MIGSVTGKAVLKTLAGKPRFLFILTGAPLSDYNLDNRHSLDSQPVNFCLLFHISSNFLQINNTPFFSLPFAEVDRD